MKITATAKRLRKLAAMLSKNAHRWSESPSVRMMGWVDEYNGLRNTPEWNEYCVAYGFAIDHNAYDCLA